MQDEEIDIVKLYGSFKKTVVYNKLKSVTDFILNNSVWFAFFLILGGGFGYCILFSTPETFTKKILIKSDLINSYATEEIIINLNNLIQEKNKKSLSMIGLSEDIVHDIIQIKSYSQINRAYLDEQEYLTIEIIKNNEKFDSVITAIINYLESNSYSKSIKKNKEDILSQKKQNLIKEINIIDSLLNTNRITDYSGLISEKIKASNKIVDINHQLKNNKGVHLVTQSHIEAIPHPSSSYIIILFAFAFFIIGGLILWLIKR